VITNAATQARNVVGLVYVAAFAPEEGERLGEAVDPARLHDVFAADLQDELTPLVAATQRPIAELAFSEPSGAPAWKHRPSWAVVAMSDKAAGTDVVRSMAERAGATIIEIDLAA
jgi:hypothetical protein